MLLQHVLQRQYLAKTIATQNQKLKKTEMQNIVLRNQLKTLMNLKKTRAQNIVLRSQLKTLQSQLDQLKNIEIEIDRKERSIISPIVE